MRVNVHTPNFLSFRQHTHTHPLLFTAAVIVLCVCAFRPLKPSTFIFLRVFSSRSLAFCLTWAFLFPWPAVGQLQRRSNYIQFLFSLLHPALLRALLVTSTLLCVMASCRYCWESGLCGCCHQVIQSLHICVCVLGSMSMCVLSAIIISWHDSVEQRLIKFLIK